MTDLGPMPRQTRWYQHGHDSQPTQEIMPVTWWHFLAGGLHKSHGWHMLVSIALVSVADRFQPLAAYHIHWTAVTQSQMTETSQ